MTGALGQDGRSSGHSSTKVGAFQHTVGAEEELGQRAELGNRGEEGSRPQPSRMERSAEERTKYPDRINLDRRGLHGIPVLALRLLALEWFCSGAGRGARPQAAQLPAQLHQEDPQPGDDQQIGLPRPLPQQTGSHSGAGASGQPEGRRQGRRAGGREGGQEAGKEGRRQGRRAGGRGGGQEAKGWERGKKGMRVGDRK